MTGNLTTTLVLCTRDRPREVRQALGSMAAQSVPLGEVVVVDASAGNATAEEVEAWAELLPVRYLRASPPGLTRQRNLGLAHSQGGLCFFVDDDAVLDHDYVARVHAVFAADVSGSIGAVQGRVLERDALADRPVKRRLLHAWHRLFLLPRPGRGDIQASGFQTLPHGDEIPRDVFCLSGGAMTFRKTALAGLAFDEALSGAGEMEDVDIARQVARHHRLRYEPMATVTHQPSRAARDSEDDRLVRLLRHHRYLYLKHSSRKAREATAFWWSVSGLLALCLLTGRGTAARRMIVSLRASGQVSGVRASSATV